MDSFGHRFETQLFGYLAGSEVLNSLIGSCESQVKASFSSDWNPSHIANQLQEYFSNSSKTQRKHSKVWFLSSPLKKQWFSQGFSHFAEVPLTVSNAQLSNAFFPNIMRRWRVILSSG
jgi:hypothetical protein